MIAVTRPSRLCDIHVTDIPRPHAFVVIRRGRSCFGYPMIAERVIATAWMLARCLTLRPA